MENLRNIAIIAHVDHGKTTLIDSIMKQSGMFRENQAIDERIMDSGDLERERGITILAKPTSIQWKDTRINIIDTPGHADFGGEVERVLSMTDGVILLTDAAEGPMPQTKFVLSKALAQGLKPIVIVNKIDRPDGRPDAVIDEVFDLFVSLDATDEQLDFPILYAAGRDGWCVKDLNDPRENLHALLDLILEHVEPPKQPQIITPTALELPILRRRDIYMEVANVAIGRAADALARHFNVFVHLPLPNVNIFEVSELHMALRDLADNDQVSGVCQGFSGEGIAGEALVLLSDSSVSDLKKLMKVPTESEQLEELELLMDVSNILVGSFLNGLGEQSEVRFFQSSPVLLGQHISIDSVIENTSGSFKKTMTFEVSYNIDGTSIRCDLLFMFVDESLPLLDNKLAYLMDEF